MDRVQFVLVIHNHQPVGNFDAVFREVTERAYLPFLRVAARFPEVRFGLHTSGCLLEWMEQHGGEYLELVREMVASGQVEILGGGMYEPILPVLPRRDALWQLRRMNDYVEQLFGVRPDGMWCPERVWEPHLPEVIAAAGLDYTLLDDFHFRSAADPDEVETEYFRTSHAGHSVNLLPISQKLRYTMPFQPVKESINYLRELAKRSEHAPLVVFGDDGEKFGNWPDTYDWVYEQGWLADFFAAISEARDWIEVLQPSEMIARRQPAGNVFIPALSYAEMGEWTRLDPDAGDDAPPGHWRNYLRKYPESKQLLDRAVHLSNVLASPQARELPDDVLSAVQTHLGKAECNCAYWHGVFGGIYLNYLRHALHSQAIQAETALHKALHEGETTVAPYPAGSELTDRYLIANDKLAAVLDAGHGLCLTRLDGRDTAFCWTNVLTRRREQYHRKLVDQQAQSDGDHASIHDRVVIKEEGLAELLEFDSHQRVSFNVRGHPSMPDPGAAPAQILRQLNSDIVFDDWTCQATDISVQAQNMAGRVTCGGTNLHKGVSMSGSAIELEAELSSPGGDSGIAAVSVEFNLTMLTDGAADRWFEAGGRRLPVNELYLSPDCTEFSLCDGWQGQRLRMASPEAHTIFTYPVYTASSSEGGFERTYQGSCIVLLFRYDGTGRKLNLRLTLEELTDEH